MQNLNRIKKKVNIKVRSTNRNVEDRGIIATRKVCLRPRRSALLLKSASHKPSTACQLSKANILFGKK